MYLISGRCTILHPHPLLLLLLILASITGLVTIRKSLVVHIMLATKSVLGIMESNLIGVSAILMIDFA